MRFSVVNIGCKVNRVEIDRIAAELREQGARMVKDEPADVVIVNTCTVTAEAEKKARKAVRQALRRNPDAPVLVCGCAVAIDPAEFTSLDARVHIVGKAHAARAAWHLAGSEPAEASAPDADLRVGEGFRTRVGIKIQDGCNNSCTYCIVHVARGVPVSEPAARVASLVRRYAEAGVRELVLTGINLGTYDSGGLDLAGLIMHLLPLIPEGRLRLSSIEPRDVSEALIDVLAASDGRVCRHLHLPLQSGSSKVLREMGRPYDAEGFLALVARLRAEVPQLSLSTDVIVGFPGETEGDFQQTLSVVRAAAFSKVHVFRYSRRAGTPAAQRADQVDAATVAARANRLSALGRELAFEDAARRAGTVEQVLVEQAGRGITESYHPVSFSGTATPGILAPFRLTEPTADGIFHL
ncbi:MAG: MiaB/RimO family radical SAM methylthiotransferase [Eggerthellaceae bacterium]|jgi:threonylcarbamoyladenosine tRNA methylthiotransferase MtaB